MEEWEVYSKNHTQVKLLSWVLIILSGIVMIRTIFAIHGYRSVITMQHITNNYLDLNTTLYFAQAAVELILCMLVFISSVFVQRYNEFWRQVLIYSLVTAILFLAFSPLGDYYNMSKIPPPPFASEEREVLHNLKAGLLYWSYTWSIIFSVLFMYVIMQLSKAEVKVLFAKDA